MIAVLMGGNSAEREISLKSGEAVYNSLKKQNIKCFKFDWKGDNLSNLWAKSFDMVFIILHGRGGEDGFIQKQLENRNISFTGSDSIASQKCMDKTISKNIWSKHKLPLAPHVVANINNPLPEINFELPWAVKPTLEGSSIGISKVSQLNELDKALKLAWKYDNNALIEKWISGVEYTVSFLNNAALPVIKIIAGSTFYDYKSKYNSNKTEYLCPCGLTKEKEQNLQKIACKAFNTIGAKNWGRIDFIIDKNQQPFLLEINTVPGMTTHSLVPKAAKNLKISFNQLVANIISFSDQQ